MSKANDREPLDTEAHFYVVDEDQERFEEAVQGIRDDLASIKRLALGLLISVTTGTILLAIQWAR